MQTFSKPDKSTDTFDIRILQMFRNMRPINANGGDLGEFGTIRTNQQNVRGLFLFDYFDCLRYYRDGEAGSQLVYGDVAALPNARTSPMEYAKDHPVVAINLTTLIDPRRFRMVAEDVDPFFADSVNATDYSSKPFLALITLNIKSVFFQETSLANLNPEEPLPDNETIQFFLCEILNQIEAETINHLNASGDEKPVIHAFWTVNTSDIVLAFRTDEVRLVYSLVHFLRNAPFKGVWKNLAFHSFTTLAMEVIAENDGYKPLANEGVLEKNENEIVVLRLYMDWQALQELQKHVHEFVVEHEADKGTITIDVEYQPEKGNPEYLRKELHQIPYGLFGHYDVTLRISFRLFAKLFPYLCTSKFLAPKQPVDGNLEPHLKAIVEGLQNHTIQISNERFSVYLDDKLFSAEARALMGASADNNKELEDKANKSVWVWRKHFQDLYERVHRLNDRIIDLPNGRRQFRENIRLLSSTLAVFAAIGDQTDSASSGRELLLIVHVFIESIEDYLEELTHLKRLVKDDSRNMEYLESHLVRLQKSMSLGIEHLNSFFRLIYAKNLQTIQVPQFEAYATIDSHKFVLAYVGLMCTFAIGHASQLCKALSSYDTDGEQAIRPIQPVFPFVSINHDEARLSMRPLFPLPSRIYREASDAYAYDHALTRLLSVSVPSLEYIVRTFDMLPLALHEVAHARRLIHHRERNDLFMHLVIKRLSNNIALHLIAYCNEHSCVAPHPGGQQLVETCVEKAFLDVQPIKLFREFNYTDLCFALSSFYKREIFFPATDEMVSNVRLGECASIRELLQKVAGYLSLYPNQITADVMQQTLKILVTLDNNGHIEISTRTWNQMKDFCKSLVGAGTGKKRPEAAWVLQGDYSAYTIDHLKQMIKRVSEVNSLLDGKVKVPLSVAQAFLYTSAGIDQTTLSWFSDLEVVLLHAGWKINALRSIVVVYRPKDLQPEADASLQSPQDQFHFEYIKRLVGCAANAITSRFSRLYALQDDLSDQQPQHTRIEMKQFTVLKGALASLPSCKANRAAYKAFMKLSVLLAPASNRETGENFLGPSNAKGVWKNLLSSLDESDFIFHQSYDEARKKLESCWKKLLAHLPLTSHYATPAGEHLRQFCNVTAPIIWRDIEGAFRQLIDLRTFKTGIDTILSEAKNEIVLFPHWYRDQLINQTWQYLHELLLHQDQQLRDACSSASLNSLLGPLTAIPDNSKQFHDSFVGTLLIMGNARAEQIVMSVADEHGESGADLLMSSEMEFTPFGYFVFVSKRSFQERLNDNNAFSTKQAVDRLRVVLAVLLHAEHEKCYQLNAIFRPMDTPNPCNGKCVQCENQGKAHLCAVDATRVLMELLNYAEALPNQVYKELARSCAQCSIVQDTPQRDSPQLPKEIDNILRSITCSVEVDLSQYVSGVRSRLLEEMSSQERAQRIILEEGILNQLSERIKGKISAAVEDPKREGQLPKDARNAILSSYYDYDCLVYYLKKFFEITIYGLIRKKGKAGNQVQEERPGYYCTISTTALQYLVRQYEQLKEQRKKRASASGSSLDPIIETIAKYCNNTQEGSSITPNEMLHATLGFTLRQYYLHQFRIHENEIDNLNAWVNGITQGGSS